MNTHEIDIGISVLIPMLLGIQNRQNIYAIIKHCLYRNKIDQNWENHMIK